MVRRTKNYVHYSSIVTCVHRYICNHSLEVRKGNMFMASRGPLDTEGRL